MIDVNKPVTGLNEAARKRLEEIRQARKKLTDKLVVDDARPAESPLHKYFEWDDKIGGEKYRLQQARSLISSVMAYYPTRKPGGTIKARVYITEAPNTYNEASEVLSDKDKAAYALASVLRELESLQQRYGHLVELAEVFAAVDRLKKSNGKKKK